MNLTLNNFLMRLKIGYVQVLLLAISIVLIYGHTLDVPFYLDDFSSIQENPVIFEWQGTLAELWQFAALRIVGYFTFALNYQFHQFQVTGYHIVNILIHFLTGCAILGLLRGLVRTPALKPVLSEESKRWLPLIVALIFVLHPLQIQGVTYIVQRLASLSALFYIATMACFIQARLTENWNYRSFWILTCLLLALFAFFTKQNTATLPISLLLLEILFFPGSKRRLILAGGIAVFCLGIAWLILAYVFKQNPFSLEAMEALTRETTTISRTSYLATQMSVLWTYIGLFFWAASSHIDYSYPITEGFLYANENYHLVAKVLHSEAIWALIGHLFILSLAAYNLRRRPLVAFGIFFYYLAHAVESSLIPIRDVIFEHRTYLPNLGLAVLCAWLFVVQIPYWLNSRLAQIIIITLLIVLGSATWQRNQMWRDPVALWQHNVEQSPEKKRGWVILGKHLVQRGQLEKEQGQTKQSQETLKKSIETLNHAIIKIKRSDGTVSLSFSVETALNLIVAYKSLYQYDKALRWVNRALAMKNLMRPFDHAKFLVNKGNIFYELKRYRESEASYRKAIQIYPHNLKARINLASLLSVTGHYDEAIALYQKVLEINPSNAYVRKILQKLQKAVR
ncbi:MAG: tetratricopeptide repeat protein [Thiomargarita sp.]|nr:tetratricopeptide repeat protein [Thiomargarita sp.]